MITRDITGNVSKPDGTPWPNANVRFDLVPGSYTDDEQIPQRSVTVTTDEVTGDFTVTLWANEEGDVASLYLCTLPSGESFHFTLPETPGTPTTLSALRAAYAGPSVPDTSLFLLAAEAATLYLPIASGALYVLKAGGTMTGPLLLPAGSGVAPSLAVGAAGTGLFQWSADALGFAVATKTAAYLRYRVLSGSDNVALYLGTGQAVTDLSNDTYVATISVPGYNQTGATSRGINFNMGQVIVTATDAATRTTAFGNVEFDFTQFQQTGGAVVFNRVFNSRFRFAIPKTGVTIAENVGIDFVVPNPGDVTGVNTAYGAINIPALTGATSWGIRYNNLPAGGSIVSVSGTAFSVVSGAALTLNATNSGQVQLQMNGTTIAYTDGAGLSLGSSRALLFLNTGRNKRLYVDFATSPRDTLVLESLGSSGGWQGVIDLNVSYSAGTVLNALRVTAISATVARVRLGALPTSATGLAAGDLWNNANVVNIV